VVLLTQAFGHRGSVSHIRGADLRPMIILWRACRVCALPQHPRCSLCSRYCHGRWGCSRWCRLGPGPGRETCDVSVSSILSQLGSEPVLLVRAGAIPSCDTGHTLRGYTTLHTLQQRHYTILVPVLRGNSPRAWCSHHSGVNES